MQYEHVPLEVVWSEATHLRVVCEAHLGPLNGPRTPAERGHELFEGVSRDDIGLLLEIEFPAIKHLEGPFDRLLMATVGGPAGAVVLVQAFQTTRKLEENGGGIWETYIMNLPSGLILFGASGDV